MTVKPRLHSVCLPETDHHVLHVGSCTCGWKVGYDGSSYELAVARAQQHCADELEAELSAGPEVSG